MNLSERLALKRKEKAEKLAAKTGSVTEHQKETNQRMETYTKERRVAGKEYAVDTSSALPESLPDLQDELMRLKYNDDQKSIERAQEILQEIEKMFAERKRD